jgi:hypothetical protein
MMAIALSQADYWSLLWENETTVSQPDAFDSLYQYPARLGQGFVREIYLRDGLTLAIADYQSHHDIVIESGDRSHPLEYTFDLSCRTQNPSQPIS